MGLKRWLSGYVLCVEGCCFSVHEVLLTLLYFSNHLLNLVWSTVHLIALPLYSIASLFRRCFLERLAVFLFRDASALPSNIGPPGPRMVEETQRTMRFANGQLTAPEACRLPLHCSNTGPPQPIVHRTRLEAQLGVELRGRVPSRQRVEWFSGCGKKVGLESLRLTEPRRVV